MFSDGLDIHVGGDEILTSRHVDTHVAGVGDRRAGHPDMDLAGAGIPQHLHEGARGRAPHDRIVDHDHALAGEVVGERVELHPDFRLAKLLGGLDERAPDIAVLGESLGVRDARFLGESDGVRGARVGYGDDDVGVDRRLASQLPTEALTGAVHQLALIDRVGPGEVDLLERAERVLLGHRTLLDAVAVGVQSADFARCEFVDQFGTDGGERTGFRGQQVTALKLAEDQRAETPRIPDAVDRVAGDDRQGEGSFGLGHEHLDPVHPIAGTSGEQMNHHLGVRRGLQSHAPLQELAPKDVRVHEVAVVGNAQRTINRLDDVRLSVAQAGAARGAVPGVTDRELPLQRGEVVLVEHGGDETLALVDMRDAMVDRRHTGRLLASMLEGVEREERKSGRVLIGGVDTDDTALLLQFVAVGVAAPNLRIVGKHGSPFVECRSGVEYSL